MFFGMNLPFRVQDFVRETGLPEGFAGWWTSSAVRLMLLLNNRIGVKFFERDQPAGLGVYGKNKRDTRPTEQE